MFIRIDTNTGEVKFNHEQLLVDNDFRNLHNKYGWRAIIFCICYYWSGSPYAIKQDSDRYSLAYDNAVTFPTEDDYKFKGIDKESKELFERCGKKTNEIFPTPEYSNYITYIKQEDSFRNRISTIDLNSTDDEDAISKLAKASSMLGQGLKTVSSLRKDSEVALDKRLSEVKFASLTDFIK